MILPQVLATVKSRYLTNGLFAGRLKNLCALY